MKIVITAEELKQRYPDATVSEIDACFMELVPDNSLRQPHQTTLMVKTRKFGQGKIGPNISTELDKPKTFNEWKSYKLDIPKDPKRIEVMKDRFEWYCAGWLHFFDSAVMKDKDKHEIIFKWGNPDPSTQKYDVTVYIHPEYHDKPYYPPPPNKKDSNKKNSNKTNSKKKHSKKKK